MNRRFAMMLVSLVASLAVVLSACASTPQAPALTDPKEILAASIVSIKDVKTFEVTGSFTGAISAAQLGNIDLSAMKLSGAVDIPNKKAKVSLDAATFLGTKVDAILIDKTAYYKVAGPLAAALHATADKYTKTDVPSSADNPAANVTDVPKAVADIKAALDKLPTPPTKSADEKCGDQDCYHVTLPVSAADIKAMNPTATADGSFLLDVWARKSDYRPAKIAVSITTTEAGTFGITLDMKYDTSVSIDAPAGDQLAP